jgi:hypothetical protein
LADLTRIWLLRDADHGGATPPNDAPLVAAYMVRPSTGGWRVRAEMGEASPPPGAPWETGDWRALLGRVATLHAGQQIALRAPASLLEHAAREALGLTGFDLPAQAHNVVVDWPARSAAHLRCAFIGLDLDWAPPPPPATVARFPGGPGSAATSRS